MKYVFPFLLLLSFTQVSVAQQTTQFTEKDYSSGPVWIQMIDDTLANYFEVEKAYTIYWQHREKPSEDEFEGKRDKDEEVSKKDAAETQWKVDMCMAIRNYKIWHMEMLPYVQNDGRILTPTERIAAWQQQQDMLKQQANIKQPTK